MSSARAGFSYALSADALQSLRSRAATQPISTHSAMQQQKRHAAQLASDVAAFIARGGVIQRLGNTPLRSGKTRRELDDKSFERAVAAGHIEVSAPRPGRNRRAAK